MSDRKHVTIFTDGACKGNPGPGGYGIILTYGTHTKELSKGFRKTTNNRMELLGCIVGFQSLKEPCTVTVFSDSKYVVRAVEEKWLVNWSRFGWRTKAKEPVKNRDLWELLLRLTRHHEVTFNWVKGHAGHKENERCDELATAAATTMNLQIDDGFENDSYAQAAPKLF